MPEKIGIGGALDKYFVDCIRDAHEYHEVRAMIEEWLKRYEMRFVWNAKLVVGDNPPVQYSSYLLALQAALELVSEKRKRDNDAT